MNLIHSTRRAIGIGALGLGLLAVPAVASAAPAAHPAHSVVAGATTTPPTTPKAPKAPKTPKATTAPVVKTYTVVTGTYRTQAIADKHLAKITAKGINGLSVVKIGKTPRSTRYRVEEPGLSRTDAKALWKQLRKAHFFAYFTAR